MKQNRFSGALRHVAIYARVSSEEQSKFGDSLRDQLESCTRYIDTHDDLILQGTYVDEGISGQKLDRDSFTRLMAAVQAGQVQLIIFTKLDRWFRSLRHYLNTQETLDKYGVAWLAVNQPYFDTSTPFGRAFVNQSMTWAELEAQNGAIRVKDVFRSKVQNGEVISGKVPLGYCIENKHLILGEQAPAALAAFQHYDTYGSLAGTLRMLKNDFGIVMTQANLRASVLQNRKYIGEYRDNLSYCPALIDRDTFERVQLQLAKNVKESQRYDYIFSGLLRCGECGRKLAACHINVVSHKKGNTYRYRYPGYYCQTQKRLKDCSNGGEIREVTIENYLLEHIRPALEQYIADYKAALVKKVDYSAKRRSLQGKIDRLKDLYLADGITLDEFKKYKAEYTEQLEQIPIEEAPSKDLTLLERFLDMDFETIYSTFNNIEKRRFWRSIISEIRVSKSTSRKREFQIFFL